MNVRAGVTYPGQITDKPGVAMGGLGTATLEIDRSGRLAGIRVQNDWQAVLDPTPAASFLSVHAREAGRPGGAGCVLQLEPRRHLPGVETLHYTGRFPFTRIDYNADALPCDVQLEAFSPFVPQDAEASSLPIVFFSIRLTNRGNAPLTAAAALSWTNHMAGESYRKGWPAEGNVNRLARSRGEPAVRMESRQPWLADCHYLLSCMPIDGVRYEAVTDWWRGEPGRWRGPDFSLGDLESMADWRAFLERGELPGEADYDDGLGMYSYHQPVGAVAGQTELAPGEPRVVRFALSWSFPHHRDRYAVSAVSVDLGHAYATRFPQGAPQTTDWAASRYERLRRDSELWRTPLEQSDLPPYLRAWLGEVLYLLPRISWWLGNGDFCLYESVNCPRMHPTILERYIAPVLAALFPDLHGRALEMIAACQLESGELPSTLGVASVRHHEFRVFSPGDASIFPLAVWWHVLWSGDDAFAARMAPVVKRMLHWAVQTLDDDGDGVPDVHGIDQGWDTFPMYGAAAYIADQWIAGLMAARRLARHVGDDGFADWCESLRRRASDVAENDLWNGEYYDLAFERATGKRSAICFADQFTYGTVAARFLGLGDVHPPERVRRGLESIQRLNVEPANVGVRMGANPDGSPADCTVHADQKGHASQSNAFTPVNSIPLAAAMIQQGMVARGLELAEETARIVLERHQEPWTGGLLFDSHSGDFFYGLHYCDVLIIWDAIHALHGVEVDMPRRRLHLAPARIPLKCPLYSRLFTGQVEWSDAGVRLTNLAPTSCRIDALELAPPGHRNVARFTEVVMKPGESARFACAHA